jgi:hypothetical protein
VDAVVEGSVSRSGERVRITAQSVQVPANTHMSAQSHDQDIQGTLALQSNVARDLAGRIQVTLNRQEQQRCWKAKTVNPRGFTRTTPKDGTFPPRLCFPK